MKQKYKRVTAGFYENEAGERINIRPVNREYAGRVKKPVYFLSEYNPETKQFSYISGLFKTRQERIFSYDIKDQLGIKILQVCSFSEGGDCITLQSKESFQRGLA